MADLFFPYKNVWLNRPHHNFQMRWSSCFVLFVYMVWFWVFILNVVLFCGERLQRQRVDVGDGQGKDECGRDAWYEICKKSVKYFLKRKNKISALTFIVTTPVYNSLTVNEHCLSPHPVPENLFHVIVASVRWNSKVALTLHFADT